MGLRAPPSDDRMRLSEDPPVEGGYASGLDRPRLGVGSIIGDSFSIFIRRIHWFAALAFVPQLLGALVVIVGVFGSLTAYTQVTAGKVGVRELGSLGAAAYVLIAVTMLLVMLIPVSLSVLAAYDARLGRPFRVIRYLTAGLAPILPLSVCWLIVVVLWLLASTLFIVPGLWVLSVFAVFAPAVVVERAGLGGLGRSIALTKGYRWPILGTMILVWLLAMLVGVVASIAFVAVDAALLAMLSGGGTAADLIVFVVSLVLQSLNVAVTYGLPCIAITVIYARLREIKEGAGAESLAEVFA